MDENELAAIVVDSCVHIHKALGPGLLESVYESILAHELLKRGLHVERQVPIPVVWDGTTLDEAFRADLVIDGKLLVELKAVEKMNAVYKRQVLTYLKISGMTLGLLVNFGSELMKDGIERIIHGYL